MASPVPKKPPAQRHRRGNEQPDSPPCDQTLVIVFKKLKMDAEGGCVKKTEDQGAVSLKHKQDVREAEPKDPGQPEKSRTTSADTTQPEEVGDDWSQSLQKFCFCDEGAVNGKGRPRWRSMCRYHRLRAKKDAGSKGGRSGSNLVQAWHAHKPLLRESKLRLAERPGTPFTMRAARFNFKPSRHTEIRFNFVKPGETAFGSKPEDRTKALAAGSASGKTQDAVHATKNKLVPVSGAAASPLDSAAADASESANTRATPAPSQPVFAAEASKRLLSFSSVSSKPGQSGASPSCQPVPKFEGHRSDRSDRRHQVSLWSQRGANRPSRLSSNHSEPSGAASVTAVPSRLDLSVERSCSQEARLDESEFNVNELAAYFDNFLYMPKEMSSMAQMMYT